MHTKLRNIYKSREGKELVQLNYKHHYKLIISTLLRLFNELEVWAQIPENQVNTDMHIQSYYMIGSLNKLEANQILQGNTIVLGNWSLTILLSALTKFY